MTASDVWFKLSFAPKGIPKARKPMTIQETCLNRDSLNKNKPYDEVLGAAQFTKHISISCQKMSKVVKAVKSCQELSEVVKSCQKLSKFVISCQKLSKVVKSCHKLS